VWATWLCSKAQLAECKKHKATKLLCQADPGGSVDRADPDTTPLPHQGTSLEYSGFAIETHSSAAYCSVKRQLQKSKKHVSVRGLNRDCNHDLKNLFKSAAVIASSKPGPIQEFYAPMVAKA
jgi:hypothetical protein